MMAKKSRQETDTSESMEFGEAIHCYILEPDTFNDRFCIPTKKVSGLMGTFIDCVQVLESNSDTADNEIYRLAYEKSGFKLPLDRVISDFEKPENQAYYNFLKENSNKIQLTSEQFEVLKRIKASISKHRYIQGLVSPDEEGIELFNELEIYWEYKVVQEDDLFSRTVSIPCKSKLDRLIIDHKNRIIRLIDLKSTSKPNSQFTLSVAKYGYHRQMMFYFKALSYWQSQEGNEEIKNYTLENPYILALETLYPNEAKLFQVSDKSLKIGLDEIDSAMNKLTWHYTNNVWEDKMSYLETVEQIEIEK